jgi:hypothetical protein
LINWLKLESALVVAGITLPKDSRSFLVDFANKSLENSHSNPLYSFFLKLDNSLPSISYSFKVFSKTLKLKIVQKKITYFKWVIFDLVEYTIGDLICFENKQELPPFGKIKHLIVHEDNLYFF